MTYDEKMNEYAKAFKGKEFYSGGGFVIFIPIMIVDFIWWLLSDRGKKNG